MSERDRQRTSIDSKQTVSRPGPNYPEDWSSRVDDVRERDRYQCQNCKRHGGPHGPATLDTDHRVPVGAGGAHQLSNLGALCQMCHNAKHGNGKAPGYYYDIARDEPTEVYQALLDTAKETHDDLFCWDSDRNRYFIL